MQEQIPMYKRNNSNGRQLQVLARHSNLLMCGSSTLHHQSSITEEQTFLPK
ncbi:hypothetical protein M758_12G082900 [Ceratodon purpureus]|nr:hypothetical protein M758_12G082900 [Ceratodon purpureus]